MKERIRIAIAQYFPWMAAFVICLIALRLYEIILTTNRLESGSVWLALNGIMYDANLGLTCGLAVFLIHLLISLIHGQTAKAVTIFLMAIVVLGSFAIIHYFTITLIPLSSDFFGYSFSEIRTTIGSSGGSSATTYLIAIASVAVFFSLGWFLQSKFSNDLSKWKVYSGIALTACVLFPSNPQPENFERTLDYYVTLNKPSHFAEQSFQYWRETQSSVEAITGYPLMHPATYSTSLNKYLNKVEAYPNIVLIIVEGLGRDFTGVNARYGGFTPFLDSLAKVSLSWNNMISNAGRTYGALPSLLGSLPYGQNGFMSYGNKMPNHQTLISLLKPFGYTSRFFYGGNPNFDNQDLFLERNGIDFMLNESNFPDTYSKMIGTEAGSWGYADKDVFTEALNILTEESTPRLDVYLTLTTHEPFISPEEQYTAIFEEKLKSQAIPAAQLGTYEANKGIFSCLLYTDDAIRQLIKNYSKRSDFEKTLFIITGDHRLIPLPSDNPIARFHVPLIMYSPMMKSGTQVNGVSSHSGLTPTLLGWLKNQYGMEFPQTMPFLTDSLSFDETFSVSLDLPLTRNKNLIEDYIDRDYFLAGERLYKILPALNLQPESNTGKKEAIQAKIARFKQVNRYVVESNKLDSVAGSSKEQFPLSASEEDFIAQQKVTGLNPTEQFEKARALALNKQYKESRTCLKYLLNASPNFHDARVLLARTYGWNGQYDSARLYLEQTMKRSPHYADAYVALVDIAYWSGNLKQAETLAEDGLHHHASDWELLARKARALFLKDKKIEAKKLVDKILSQQPNNEIALDLKSKLK